MCGGLRDPMLSSDRNGPVPSAEDTHMPRYMVERDFPKGLDIPVTPAGAEACLNVVGVNARDGVTWGTPTSAPTGSADSARAPPPNSGPWSQRRPEAAETAPGELLRRQGELRAQARGLVAVALLLVEARQQARGALGLVGARAQRGL